MGRRLLLPLLLLLTIPLISYSQCEKWDISVNQGGALDDYHMDTEIDPFGNQIICGYFYSDSLTVGDTTFQRVGTYNGFIVKLDSTGHATWAINSPTVVIYDAETDASGNIYFTGYTSNHFNGINNSFPWRTYMFVFKYGPNGNQIWNTRSGGGGGANVIGYNLSVSPSGQVAVTGYYTTAAAGFSGWGSLNNPTNTEGYVVKYNSNGTAAWAHGYYSPNNAYARHADFDLSGNVYVVGYSDGNTVTLNGQVYNIQGGFDSYVTKINSGGVIQWHTMMNGASGDDYLTQVKVNNFGKAFISGYWTSDTISIGATQLINTDPGAGTREAFLGEISSTGSMLWTSNFNSPGNNLIYELDDHADKGLYIAGYFDGVQLSDGQDTLINTNAGFYDAFGGLVDFSGNLVWARSGGGLANDYGFSINVMPNEDIILSYRTNSPTYTMGNQTINGAGSWDMGYSILKNEPIEFVSSVTQVTCGIGNDGAISVNYSGGQAPYTEVWSHGPTGTTLSNLVPGNYTLTVRDANGCETQQTFNIQQQITLDPTVTVFSADTCGANNGMAIASVTGGAPPYSFLWSTGSTNQVISNLASGQYTLSVTDANNCEVIRVIDVGGSSPPQVTTTSTPTSTCGSSDGIAIVNVAGQNPPFTVQWSSGQITSVVPGLPKGWYSVDVTDSTGCQASDSVFVDGPDKADIIANISNPSCTGDNDGKIDLSVSGGLPPYSYTWAHGPTTEDLDSLAPGTYSVSIIDSDFANNNCTTYDTFVIADPLPLGVNIDSIRPTCTQSNGSITAFGQGGYPPYQFLWSTGDTISTLFNVQSGQYWVRVRDSRQCEFFRVIDLDDNVTFTTTLTTFNSDSCSQNTGVASVSMVGGQFPFTINWSNGATGPFVNQLPAGNYTVTISDAAGCSETIPFTIAGYNKPFLNLTKNDPQSCGGSDGAAVLQISGQAGPYNINWSTNDSTQVLFNLSAGWYSVIVTDTNGCSSTDSVELTDPPRPRFALNAQDQSCFNIHDGSIDLTILAGKAPFSYKWSNGLRTSDLHGLQAGTYYVNVYDSASSFNGCYGLDSITISRPPEMILTPSSTNANCGFNNGSASITINGGIPPYDHRWTNGDETTFADSLAAGIYVVEVEDATGCKVDKQILISDAEAPTITANQINPVSCFGGNNGSIDISVLGGISPFNYWWTNGSTSEDISNLSVGPYEVMLIDGDSCVSLATFEVTQPSEISLSTTTTKTDCGLANGSAVVHATGGSGPYIHNWSNGSFDSIANSLSAGFYSVFVTDQNGCSDSIWAAVSEIAGPEVVLDSVIQPSCSSPAGSIYVTATGVNTPFNYTWSSGSNVEDLISVGSGVYNLTVSNTQGCLGTATANLGASPNFGDPICLVTVDSSTGANLIVWEKNYFAGIDHYNIYRESSAAGVYQLIGSVPFSQDGEFIDPVALPLFRSWKYKISAVDTCGNESSLSPEHKTIHLTQSLGLVPNSINLSWDDYQGFAYSTYFIYRNTLANGWEKIDSVPATLNSYTDVIPTLINDPWLYYVIMVRPAIGCDTDKKGKTFRRSKSNDSNSTNSAQVSGKSISKLNSIGVYPNPFNKSIEIEASGFNDLNGFNIRILDAKGSVKYMGDFTAKHLSIPAEHLNPGIYIVELASRNEKRTVKLIKY